MSNQVKDEKKSLKIIAEEMKEGKLSSDKLKKVQKIMKIIFKKVKDQFLSGEGYKILDFPEKIFFDGEDITFSEMKFPKINTGGTQDYMDKNKNLIHMMRDNKQKKKLNIDEKKMKEQHIIYLLGKLTYYLLNANQFFSMNTLYINIYPKKVQYFLDVTLRLHNKFQSFEELNEFEFFKKDFGDEIQKECSEITSKIQQTSIMYLNNQVNEKGNEIENDLNDIVLSSNIRNVINYSSPIIPFCVKNGLNKEQENLLDPHKINEWKNHFNQHIDEIFKKNIGC